MNHLTDIIRAERIVRQERDREHIRNAMAAQPPSGVVGDTLSGDAFQARATHEPSRKRLGLSVGIAIALAGCAPEPTDPMPAETSSTGQVRVERIAVIADDLAYGERRGVYLIRDNATGEEFIGVSGVGISQRGSHPAGKVVVGDER